MGQWYTLHTKPNSEYVVATTLRKRNLKMYLPEIEVPKTRPGLRKKPCFPGYLFVNLDFEAVDLSNLRWIPGLHQIVAFDDRPVPVPSEIINLIRLKLGEIEATGGGVAHPFKPGDTVRITDGPFRDLLAIFDGPTTATNRVQVLLKILGASRVRVEVSDLEKVPSSAEVPTTNRPRRTRGQGRRINY